MGLRLHIRIPDAAPRFVDLLDETEVLVGRAGECAVTIPHGTLSSRHASIRVRSGRVEVRDEGSRFGTQIGTIPVLAGAWTAWTSTDVLWLGDVELAWEALDDDRTVVLDAPAAPAPPVADDSALWSVAMERDRAHWLVSQEAPRPLPDAPHAAGVEVAPSRPSPVADDLSELSLASGEAEERRVPALPSGNAAPPQYAEEGYAPVPDAAGPPRARVSGTRRLIAAAAALVCAGALVFGAWVVLG